MCTCIHRHVYVHAYAYRHTHKHTHACTRTYKWTRVFHSWPHTPGLSPGPLGTAEGTRHLCWTSSWSWARCLQEHCLCPPPWRAHHLGVATQSPTWTLVRQWSCPSLAKASSPPFTSWASDVRGLARPHTQRTTQTKSK